MAVIVRRVVESRKALQFPGLAPSMSNAPRTLPLGPVAEKPKTTLTSDDIKRRNGTIQKPNFWGKLKCW
jgi:hypothetical protein